MNFISYLLVLATLAPLSALAALENWKGTHVYIAYPPIPPGAPKHSLKNRQVVLYLSDIAGIRSSAAQQLADKFANLGSYIVVAPDLFAGDAVAENATSLPEGWLDRHTPLEVEPIIDFTIEEIQKRFKPKSIGATGYCFGGRYVFRYLAAGKVSAGVSAHPSAPTMEEIAAAAAKGPIQLALAAEDLAFPTEMRHQTEAVLANSSANWQSNVFGGEGIGHGFAVRPGVVGNRYHKWAIEKAAGDAVAWFKLWLK